MQAVQATALSPLSVAAYVLGFVLCLPTLYYIIRAISFFTTIINMVKAVSPELRKLTKALEDAELEGKMFRHEIREILHWYDIRLTRTEDKLGMESPPRPKPE